MGVPKYQLYYFPVQGLAETSRLILEHAGAPYENVMVQDWVTEKPKTPLGKAPVLWVTEGNGPKVQIAESHAIERYLARELGLLGTTSLEAAHLEMYQETWLETVYSYSFKVQRVPEEEKKAALEVFWVKATEFLKFQEAILKKQGPFYGGSQITLPDIFAFTVLNRIIDKLIGEGPEPFTEDAYPHLFALWKGVKESKGIKEYFDSGRYVMKR